MNTLKMSWRTTTFAAIAALGIIFTQIGYGFDDDPNTITNWDLIMKTVGAFFTATGMISFGLSARDKKVSDEQSGAGRS